MPKQILEIDKQSLVDLNKIEGIFKTYQKKIVTIRFILINMNEKNWILSINAINIYKKLFNLVK